MDRDLLYDPTRDVFLHVVPDTTLGRNLSSERIASFFVDSQDRIWLITDNDKLHLMEMPAGSWELKDIKITHIAEMDNASGLPKPVNARILLQDKNDVFWIHAKKGLFRFREDKPGHFIVSDLFPESDDPEWRNMLEGFDEEKEKYFIIGPGRNGSIWVAGETQIGHWDPVHAT